MRKFVLGLTTVLALSVAAAPAFAKNDNPKKNDPPGQSQNPPNNAKKEFVQTPCEPAGIQLSAIGCKGWFEGNLNKGGTGNGTLDERMIAADALNELAAGEYTFAAATLEPLSKLDTGGGVINFGQMLYGITLVGFHVGGAGGNTSFAVDPVGYNGTAFFKFDAGAGMANITFNMPGMSNAALYATGMEVPEPTTWALMILGFGGAGAMLRRRKTALA